MGIKILHLRHRQAPLPGACRWCGYPSHGHANRWVPGQRWHAYVQPTQEQIKARMLAQRRNLAPRIVTNLASDNRTRI